MPRKKLYDKEMIRRYGGKYARGNAGFSLSMNLFRGTGMASLITPPIDGVTGLGKPTKVDHATYVNELYSEVSQSAEVLEEKVYGDLHMSSGKSAIINGWGGDPESKNKLYAVMKEDKQRVDGYVKGLFGDAKPFSEYIAYNNYLAIPEGDFAEGYLDNPYLHYLSNTIIGGGPKLGQIEENGEVLKDANGLPVIDFKTAREGLQGEPYNGALGVYNELCAASRQLWEREFERQTLVAGGYTAQQEKAYLIRLHDDFNKMQTAYMHACEVEEANPDKYDDTFMNNSLAELTGVKVGEDRGIYGVMGYIEGMQKAIENGWGIGEMDPLGYVGYHERYLKKELENNAHHISTCEKEIQKYEKELETLQDPARIETTNARLTESRNKLEAYKGIKSNLELMQTGLQDLKKEVWDKKVTNAAEKLEVFQKIEQYRESIRNIKIADKLTNDKELFYGSDTGKMHQTLLDNCKDRLLAGVGASNEQELVTTRKNSFIAQGQEAAGRLAELDQKEEERLAEKREEFGADYDPVKSEADPEDRADYYAYMEEAQYQEYRVVLGKLAERFDEIYDVKDAQKFMDSLIDKYDLTVEDGVLKADGREVAPGSRIDRQMTEEIATFTQQQKEKSHQRDLQDQSDISRGLAPNPLYAQNPQNAVEAPDAENIRAYIDLKFEAQRLADRQKAGDFTADADPINHPGRIEGGEEKDPFAYVKQLEEQAAATGNFKPFVKAFNELTLQYTEGRMNPEQEEAFENYRDSVLQKGGDFLKGFITEQTAAYLDQSIALAQSTEILAEEIRNGSVSVDPKLEPIKDDYRVSKTVAGLMLKDGYLKRMMNAAMENNLHFGEHVAGYDEFVLAAEKNLMNKEADGLSVSQRKRLRQEGEREFSHNLTVYGLDTDAQLRITDNVNQESLYEEYLKSFQKASAYAEEMEKMRSEAAVKLDGLRELEKLRSNNSPQFTAMVKALENVSKLSMDSTPAQVDDTLNDLRKASEAYKDKIDHQFMAGTFSTGSRRYAFADDLITFSNDRSRTLGEKGAGAVAQNGIIGDQLENTYKRMTAQEKKVCDPIKPGKAAKEALKAKQEQIRNLKFDEKTTVEAARYLLGKELAELVAIKTVADTFKGQEPEKFVGFQDNKLVTTRMSNNHEKTFLTPEKLETAKAKVMQQKPFQKLVNSAKTMEDLKTLKTMALDKNAKSLMVEMKKHDKAPEIQQQKDKKVNQVKGL
ncbi:MAG: hypothetical protein K6E84_01725 [Lachnospiraceae bacterium]|nr:hypothetical protein [Lachnospiraceae bacterium]